MDSLDEVKLCLVVCKDNETKELLHGLKSNRDHCVCQGHSWESSSQCIDSLQARGATSASLRTEKALFHTKSFWVFTGPFSCGKRKPFKSLQPKCLESIEFDALDILTSHGTSLMHTKCLPGPCLFFGYLALGHLFVPFVQESVCTCSHWSLRWLPMKKGWHSLCRRGWDSCHVMAICCLFDICLHTWRMQRRAREAHTSYYFIAKLVTGPWFSWTVPSRCSRWTFKEHAQAALVIQVGCQPVVSPGCGMSNAWRNHKRTLCTLYRVVQLCFNKICQYTFI